MISNFVQIVAQPLINANSMKNNISNILITDIVGYSKLSGDNQDVALDLLKEHDKILIEAHDDFNGNILKNRGDGVISQFDDSIECIKCAVQIQRKLKKRNILNVKERNLKVRVGIHYGEYIKDGNEIHGECINVASKLEPLAPHGGIVVSSQLAEILKNEKDIYLKEHKYVKIDNEPEMIYEVCIDLYDWFHDNKKIGINSDNFIKAHELFHKGDFSGSIKNTILYKESSNVDQKNEINSFLVNLFINIGNFNEAEISLNEIINNTPRKSQEQKAHLSKMKAHLFFNEEDWENAKKSYDESLSIFKKNKSKYVNEILFHKAIIDVMNDENELSDLREINDISFEDDYFHLISILENIFDRNKKAYDINIDINRIEQFENNRLKAYGFWLISKICSKLNDYDKAYIYETKSQDYIKLSSKDISDVYLRDNYLESIFLHKTIITETSISVDDLFKIDEEDELANYKDFELFDFCVNCGIENKDNKSKCNECETILIKQHYENS